MQPITAAGSGDIAEITARILLEIEAVLFRPDEPFILTSGRASPVYVDCRKIISFPRARAQLMDLGCALIKRQAGFEAPPDPEVADQFEELRYLERAIGRTGTLAMAPIFNVGSRDLWQLHMLRQK